MMRTRLQAPGVHYADEEIVSAAAADLDPLVDEVHLQAKGRSRICTHRDIEDPLQEMFITFTRDTYLRPSLHRKDESLHVLRGAGTYVFFNDAGGVEQTIRLGEWDSDRSFYCRIPRDTFHALVVESEIMTVHEVTEGPFSAPGAEFAPWAPPEEDTAAVTTYMRELGELVRASAAGR